MLDTAGRTTTELTLKVPDGVPAVEVVELRKEFLRRNKQGGRFRNRRRRVPALKGLTFTMERGETVAILGQNGSGKSTLLTALLRPDRRLAARYYAYVPDDDHVDRGEARSFLHDITLTLSQGKASTGPRLIPRSEDLDLLRQRFIDELSRLRAAAVRDNTTAILLIDGLDHVERAPRPRDPRHRGQRHRAAGRRGPHGGPGHPRPRAGRAGPHPLRGGQGPRRRHHRTGHRMSRASEPTSERCRPGPGNGDGAPSGQVGALSRRASRCAGQICDGTP